MVVVSISTVEADTGIGGAFVEMQTIEDIRKKLQEINEHIKKEQNKSQIPRGGAIFLNVGS